MFKLDPKPTFWSAVHLSVPGEEARVAIEMQFVHKCTDDIKEWLESAASLKDGDALCGIVRGWKGVDADFTEDAMRRLVRNYPAAAREILEQYLRALTESRAKN